MLKLVRLEGLNPRSVERLCRRNPPADERVLQVCREIFHAVERRGDAAVREFTRRFDGARVDRLRVSPAEFRAARNSLSVQVREALGQAAANIEAFHRAQRVAEPALQVQTGVRCWRESRPLESVGLYVPGGSAVLASTGLMLGIPARLAGCPRVALCVPPRPDGGVSAEVLQAAELAEIDEVYRIGGAQAIAALAVGTASLPRVDKIFGPGSPVVQAAKQLAYLRGTAIDMLAGPSEVLVVADSAASPEFVAADLLSQAEHGPDSRAALVSTCRKLIGRVDESLQRRLRDLPRSEFARQALANSFALLTASLPEAFEFANRYAPEHLVVQVEDARRWVGFVRSAGSVFLGPWSPEAAGDYATGTNHVLPTSGSARAVSGISLDSFLKKITFQELQPEGLRDLAATLTVLARMEGLEGHARAVLARTASLGAAAEEGASAAKNAGRVR